MPAVITSYAALLAAADGAPVVRHDVGPHLLAPALALGRAVLLLRRIQTGAIGAVALGPLPDVTDLLASNWRAAEGYAHLRSLTVERDNHGVLEALGARDIGLWSTMVVDRCSLRRVEGPPGLTVDVDVPRAQARAFVDEHYHSRWLAPPSPAEVWGGVRDGSGDLVAAGMVAPTAAGIPRLAGITVPVARRGQGLGRLVTHVITEIGLAGAPVVTLGVDDDNLTARRTYAALGFTVTHAFSSGTLPGPRTPTDS